MRVVAITGIVVAAVAAVRSAAHADGYCDHVEGVAAAERALLYAPELFGSVGFVEQTAAIDAPEQTSDDLRITAGIRYRLGGLYQAGVVRRRARADCRRHHALSQVQDATAYRALAARVRVLDDALAQAEQMLDDARADLAARRATTQEVTATRLRVDELRELAAQGRIALEALPAPADGSSPAGALAAFYAADAEVERQDGRLRRARAWDVSVRVGYDRFLANDADETPVFAVVSVNFNLGWLVQGSANRRAADGRRRAVRDDRGVVAIDRLRAMLAIEQRRQDEAGVLVADLEDQLEQLRRIGGDSSRRHRATVWFEWVKLKAEHAYLAAHVESLQAVLGEDAP
jgi:hypothetical protein